MGVFGRQASMVTTPSFEAAMATVQLGTARRHHHRARPAVAAVAAMLGAGQVRSVAERPQQGRLRVEEIVNRLAVDGHSGHEAIAKGSRAACKAVPAAHGGFR